MEHPKGGAHARFGDATTLGDVKMLAPGQAYSEPPPTAIGASVQKRAAKVHNDSHITAKKLDEKNRHARGRNWACRDRDELLQLETRSRL